MLASYAGTLLKCTATVATSVFLPTMDKLGLKDLRHDILSRFLRLEK